MKIGNCVRGFPGSARASRAGDGALAIANFAVEIALRRGDAMSTRGRVRSPESSAPVFYL